MNNSLVYTVTVIDLQNELPLGIRRTPLICSTIESALYAVKNNSGDLADGGLYQYAVIEKSYINTIRPNLEKISVRLWYKYNPVTDEFEPCEVPAILKNQTGFGIG